jgi:hypothetical protein
VPTQRIDPDGLRQDARSQIGPYLAWLPDFTDQELQAWRQALEEAYAPTGRIIRPARDPGLRLPHARLLWGGFLDEVDAEMRRRLAIRAEAEHTVDAVMAWGAALGYPDARVKRFRPPTLGEITLKLRPIPNALFSGRGLHEIVGPAQGRTAYLQWSASPPAAETAHAVLERLQMDWPNARVDWPPAEPSGDQQQEILRKQVEWIIFGEALEYRRLRQYVDLASAPAGGAMLFECRGRDDWFGQIATTGALPPQAWLEHAHAWYENLGGKQHLFTDVQHWATWPVGELAARRADIEACLGSDADRRWYADVLEFAEWSGSFAALDWLGLRICGPGWNAEADRPIEEPSIDAEEPTTPNAFDAYWAGVIAEHPFVAWAPQGAFHSNHEFIRWLRDQLGVYGPSRGRKPRTVPWLAEATGAFEETLWTQLRHAQLAAAAIRRAPLQLDRAWRPPAD